MKLFLFVLLIWSPSLFGQVGRAISCPQYKEGEQRLSAYLTDQLPDPGGLSWITHTTYHKVAVQVTAEGRLTDVRIGNRIGGEVDTQLIQRLLGLESWAMVTGPGMAPSERRPWIWVAVSPDGYRVLFANNAQAPEEDVLNLSYEFGAFDREPDKVTTTRVRTAVGKDLTVDRTYGFSDYQTDDIEVIHTEFDLADAQRVYTEVEEMPTFRGSRQALYRYLAEEVQYTTQARRMGIQGEVWVQFVVEKDGRLSDVTIVRGIGAGCDERTLQVIQNMPRWTPGRQFGFPVRTQIIIPVRFSMITIEEG